VHAPGAGGAAGAGQAGGGDAGGAASGLDAADTGDLALIDEELAEHLRWSSASLRVGAAESTQRAAFIAEQAGAGFTEGAGSGFLMGLGMGAGTRVALKGVDFAVRRFGGRIAGGAAKFTPVPAVGAIIGGAMSAYGLATRNWEDTGKKIGRIGQGASTYEQIANTIDAISEVIDVTTNILNVIAGVCGAIAVGLWVAAVVTVGVLSPLAGILTEVALAIGAATMVLDGINAGVLHPVSLAFRALHEFTSQADPTQVEADGAELSSAAGAAGGALGGFAGGKLAHVGARPPSAHPEPDPRPDHPNPSARAGEGPTVTAIPPVDEHAAPGAATEHAPEPAPGAADHPNAPPHETDPNTAAPPIDPNAPAYRISDEANVPPAAAPPPIADQAPLPGVVDRDYGRGHSPPPGATPPPGTAVPGQPERAFIPNQPELNKPWMYDERVPNRGDLGQNVQRDHVISQQKIRDQMVDPHGVLRAPDLNSLTVLAETGKATPTSPAKPHTQATFIDPQADVPEIHRLRGLGRPANWTTDIIEPSRNARLRAGYDPAAVDTVLLDQTGRMHEQYRNHEINDALKTLATAEAKAGRTAGADTDLATLHGQLDQAFPGGPSSPPPAATAAAPGATVPATAPAAPTATTVTTSAPIAPPTAGHPAEPPGLLPDHVDTAAGAGAPAGPTSVPPGERVRIATDEPQRVRIATDEPQRVRIAIDEPQRVRIAIDEPQRIRIATDEPQRVRIATDEHPLHEPDVLAEHEHEPTPPAKRTMRVGDSTRGTVPLTAEQRVDARRRLSAQMGVPDDKIFFSDTIPTSFAPNFDIIVVGPDLNPIPVAARPTGLRNPANAALEAQAVLGHEAIGHREAWLAGQTREDVWHEEMQASARAALHTPDLPHEQAQLLMQDAAARRPTGHDETVYVFTDRVGPDGKPMPEPRGPGSAGSGGPPAPGTRPQDVLPKVMIDPSVMGPAPAGRAATAATPAAPVPAMPLPGTAATAPAAMANTPRGGAGTTPSVVAPRLPPALAAPHSPAPADGAHAPPKGNAFVRGLREGLEPIVIHANPAYTPPPVTPQQIIDIQNEILSLLAARAEAENAAARMATERSHHQAQQAPLARAHQEMSGAQTAVSAHQAAVQRRQQANEAQQRRTRESGATLAGAPNRLAGLSVITIPLGLFLNLTQYAHLLPEGSVRSGMMKMDGDSRKLLASFAEMGQSVDTQNAATPARQQAVLADAGRLGSTSQQATPTRQGFVSAASGAQALQQANSDRIARAGAAHAEANGQAQVLGNDAGQRQATVQTLSQTLQTWAQAHKAQRQAALQTTAARIEAQGGHVIQRSEG